MGDFEFHVLSVNMERGDLYQDFKELDVTIFHHTLGYFNLKKFRSFYLLLKNNAYDTVCTFNGNFGGVPLTIAKTAGVENRIAFYRRSTNAFGNNKLKRLYNNFVNSLVRKNATFILSNSETAFKNFHGDVYQSDSRYKIIKNGVSAGDFNIPFSNYEARKRFNFPNDCFMIGHVGRFDPAKNHETIFKVIQSFKENHNNFRFVFCGKDTNSVAFISKLEEYNIQDVVIALGLRSDLPMLYRALDVFYFPSITEGQPNALIEAMISGLPVVTSNISPILETLPAESEFLALSPLDVNASYEILKGFYTGNIYTELYKHEKWAKENFDPNKRFKELKLILNNS
ncbi:glycosyltransferase [Gelidibacter maritimus]|uniref:Glycosyltransferase n=1 Tax=Gelidibacter maritimus TaxID=2761487 RepID=A0A7W2M658_9FLAO|nr:glycosyltransferase [Gelidibacter maritimus]MBA6153395.1 glycosyltransferase [Gelidibacter maritimus]